jgi:putative ABC transport system substrate-binding protein
MKRRTLIAGLAGVAAWPLAARAQQSERVRRIGVVLAYEENDPVAKPRYSAFTRALAELGWTEGRNVRLDLRWGGVTSIGYEPSRGSWYNPTSS